MGDRGHVAVVQHPEPGVEAGRVYLYGHWSGADLPRVLQAALIRARGRRPRESRWDSESHLAHLIYRELIRGAEDDLTGFGITNYLTDNEYPILVVDAERQTVTAESEPGAPPLAPARAWSFEAFVALDMEEDGWEMLVPGFLAATEDEAPAQDAQDGGAAAPEAGTARGRLAKFLGWRRP